MHRNLTLLPVALALAALLAGCGGETDAESVAPTPTEFEIVPDYLEAPYENTEAGIAVRPPLGWTPLSAEQRDQVAEALLAEQATNTFGLEVIDIFLHESTLSFLTISWVVDDNGRTAEQQHYREQLWETISESGEDELRGRTTMLVNDLEILQIRHSLGERVTFTIVTESAEGQVLQLDYSIPFAAYEAEGVKLESSIGTLRRAAPADEEDS